MANDSGDDSVLDFPPLFQTMRLNVEGGPRYRGGLRGRAAAAYYREKEVMIAIKNKHGNRYGRRILSYKPDTEAWKPERYQRHSDRLNTCTPEVIPGGLQNRKPLIYIRHDRLEQSGGRVQQQEGFSRGDHIRDKYSSGTNKSEGVSVTAHRTSHTDLVELGRPFQQGRGMMRGKRVVDISAIYCADEKEDPTVNCIINQKKRESGSSIQKDRGKLQTYESDKLPSELTKSGGKQGPIVNCIINPEKREPESSIQKDQENIIIHRSNQHPSELIKLADEKEELNPEYREPENIIQKIQRNMRDCESDQSPPELIKSADEKEELTVNSIINPENREPENIIQEVQRNMSNCESDQSPPELIKSDEKEELIVNCSINPEKIEHESSIQKVQGNMINCECEQFPSELIKSDEKEELTVNCIINSEKRETESSIQKDQRSMINNGSNQSPSELIKSDEKEELTVNRTINPEKREPENSIQKDIISPIHT